MSVWSFDTILDKYKSFVFVNEDEEFIEEFKEKVYCGKCQNGELDYKEIKVLDGEEDSDLAQLWNATFAPLISEKAKKCLENLLKGEVEFIPLKYENSTMYIINVLKIIDAIDYENSVYRDNSECFIPPGGIINPKIKEYVLLNEKVQGSKIFRVLYNGKIRKTVTFVSSEVKHIIDENSLTGFEFEEVLVSN